MGKCHTGFVSIGDLWRNRDKGKVGSGRGRERGSWVGEGRGRERMRKQLL